MTLTIVRVPKYYIQYRTTNQVSRVKNELAGSFSYYAEAQDALDSGLFCEKILSPIWGDISDSKQFDFLGKHFAVILLENLSATESHLIESGR